MFRFQVIQVFCIFNHLIIYQICDVMMSTWDKVHIPSNISLEPKLIKSPNLANWLM